MNDIIKKYPDWLQSMYKLRFWDIMEHLETIELEHNGQKINFINYKFHFDFKNFDDAIKFRCYDNDFLNVMLKNKKIDVEIKKEQLKFIEKYEVYLIDALDVKDCESLKMMLNEDLDSLKVEMEFLNELME